MLFSLFIWLFAVWRSNCEIGLWDVPLILTVWLPAEFGLLGGAKLIAGFDMGDLAPLVSGCYGFIFLRGFNVGIDYLKIDSSLVKNIVRDKKSRVIVKSIIDFNIKTDY